MSGSVDLLANAIADLRRLADAFGKLRSHSLRNRELIGEVSADQMHLAQAVNALAQEIAELRAQVGELREWRDRNHDIDTDQQNRFEG